MTQGMASTMMGSPIQTAITIGWVKQSIPSNTAQVTTTEFLYVRYPCRGGRNKESSSTDKVHRCQRNTIPWDFIESGWDRARFFMGRHKRQPTLFSQSPIVSTVFSFALCSCNLCFFTSMGFWARYLNTSENVSYLIDP
ncbi:Uncharacterized protein APZ42_011313 [Daphnia magna]|uniref:Uncharacterized protein n=1 Tax=Daphnia magna TaxID=35525 RepID=A0A0N8EDR0_9CRUS|nr:Uncharacterized protein APZ42_011313 [Daphnia magna]